MVRRGLSPLPEGDPEKEKGAATPMRRNPSHAPTWHQPDRRRRPRRSAYTALKRCSEAAAPASVDTS